MMLRTTLIYPPFVSENRAFPALSLPALAAFLRQRDYPVAQVDVNIDFYRWITQDEILQELQARLAARLEAHSNPPDTFVGLDYYCNLSDAVHVWLPYIRVELQACDGDMGRLDGTQCLYVLDKLALILGLERQNHKTPVEMTSEEIVAEICRQDSSLFASYMRDRVAPRLLATSPDVIGISLMIEQQLFPAVMLAHYLK